MPTSEWRDALHRQAQLGMGGRTPPSLYRWMDHYLSLLIISTMKLVLKQTCEKQMWWIENERVNKDGRMSAQSWAVQRTLFKEKKNLHLFFLYFLLLCISLSLSLSFLWLPKACLAVSLLCCKSSARCLSSELPSFPPLISVNHVNSLPFQKDDLFMVDALDVFYVFQLFKII